MFIEVGGRLRDQSSKEGGDHWTSLPNIQEGTRRRQFIDRGDSVRWGWRQFIELRDHWSTGYQLLREDTSHSGRRQFVEGGDPLREEVIHWERGPFIEVGKKCLTHGRRPFIRRGGHPLREGGSCSSWVGEGHKLWYELDLSWCGGKEELGKNKGFSCSTWSPDVGVSTDLNNSSCWHRACVEKGTKAI